MQKKIAKSFYKGTFKNINKTREPSPCLATVIAQGSTVSAGEDVNIKAREKDINIIGLSVSGENVTLEAKENVNIVASDNTNTSSKTRGWFLCLDKKRCIRQGDGSPVLIKRAEKEV